MPRTSRRRYAISVTIGTAAAASFLGVALEYLVAVAQVLEAHEGLSDLGRDVADGLLPLTLAPADHADERSHAVESHDAHSAGVYRVDAAVGMLQVLGIGVDEDRPREVLLS